VIAAGYRNVGINKVEGCDWPVTEAWPASRDWLALVAPGLHCRIASCPVRIPKEFEAAPSISHSVPSLLIIYARPTLHFITVASPYHQSTFLSTIRHTLTDP